MASADLLQIQSKSRKIVTISEGGELRGKSTEVERILSQAAQGSEEFVFESQDYNISKQFSTTLSTTEQDEEESEWMMLLGPEIVHMLHSYFDDLNDDEFSSEVTDVLDNFKHLKLENKILEMFLTNNEPSLLATLSKAIAMIEDLQQTAPLLPEIFEVPEVIVTPEMMLFSAGPRVNISHVSDLLLRFVEEMQNSLDTFIVDSRKKRTQNKAEVELCSIWVSETDEAINAFEETVVQAVDPITQRIPAEKFVWFMHDWMKSARLVTEKIRLRNASMKTQLNKLKALYVYKKEVGVSLVDIDFEGLRIENNNHLKTIEQNNKHLLELKTMAGRANLDLTTKKNYLSQLQVGIDNIAEAIKAACQQTVVNSEECAKAQKELDSSKQAYEQVLNTVTSCRAPAILDYVKVKAQKSDLEKQLRILDRQLNLNEVALRSFAKKMANLTHSGRIKQEWFNAGLTDDIELCLLESETPDTEADETVDETGPVCDLFEALNIDESQMLARKPRDLILLKKRSAQAVKTSRYKISKVYKIHKALRKLETQN